MTDLTETIPAATASWRHRTRSDTRRESKFGQLAGIRAALDAMYPPNARDYANAGDGEAFRLWQAAVEIHARRREALEQIYAALKTELIAIDEEVGP